MQEDIFIEKKVLVPQIWSAYKKTSDFKNGSIYAIRSTNPILIRQEKIGLERIYVNFVKKLNSLRNAKNELLNRTANDWLEEWKNMHKILYEYVFKKCGNWRQRDVRFGNPGDEDLHRITLHQYVPKEIGEFADSLATHYLRIKCNNDQDKYRILAQVHYQFIRIHPFIDGNGRIARVITDQLAVFFNFPPAMAGYPRLDSDRRKKYHESIHSCAFDLDCNKLATWIRGYIETKQQVLS